LPHNAGGRRDRDDVPRPLLAHHGQDCACDIHRPHKVRRQRALDLLRGQLLEEAGIEVAGVVDQHVDAAEAVDRGLHRRLRRHQARDVKLDDEQVVGLADGLGHGFGVAAARDDCVAGAERGLRDVDTHAAAGASDEPNPLVSQFSSVPSFLLVAGRLLRRLSGGLGECAGMSPERCWIRQRSCGYAAGGRYWTCSAFLNASIVSSTLRRTVVSIELRAPPPLMASATAAIDTLSGASQRL